MKGYFKERKLLKALFLAETFLCILGQVYSLYNMYMLTGNYIITFLNPINPDKEMTREIKCEMKNYYYFIMTVIVIMYTNEVFKKFVLYLNPTLPKFARFLLMVEILIAAILLFISSVFIMFL